MNTTLEDRILSIARSRVEVKKLAGDPAIQAEVKAIKAEIEAREAVQNQRAAEVQAKRAAADKAKREAEAEAVRVKAENDRVECENRVIYEAEKLAARDAKRAELTQFSQQTIAEIVRDTPVAPRIVCRLNNFQGLIALDFGTEADTLERVEFCANVGLGLNHIAVLAVEAELNPFADGNLCPILNGWSRAGKITQRYTPRRAADLGVLFSTFLERYNLKVAAIEYPESTLSPEETVGMRERFIALTLGRNAPIGRELQPRHNTRSLPGRQWP